MTELPLDARALWLFIAVHAAGSAFGYWWYAPQLRQWPLWTWPVIPDSPTATLLFMAVQAGFLYRFRLPVVEALAFMGMVKYGLWTPIVLGHDMWLSGTLYFDGVHLSLSHLLMAFEAWLFLRLRRPSRRAGLVALAWFIFNDYSDYVWLTHPDIPRPDLLPLVARVAFTLTVLAAALYFAYARADAE